MDEDAKTAARTKASLMAKYTKVRNLNQGIGNIAIEPGFTDGNYLRFEIGDSD